MNIKISIKDCECVPLSFIEDSFRKLKTRKRKCSTIPHKRTTKNALKLSKLTKMEMAANSTIIRKPIKTKKSTDNPKDSS